MLFSRFTLFALPFIGLASASPVNVAITKRDTAVDVLTTLQNAISSPLSTINANATDGDAIQTALSTINDAITNASSAITTSTIKRSLSTEVKRDDLGDAGAILAQVIEEIVDAVEAIAVDLEGFPLIGTLINHIDAGLNTLLLGVEIVLEGVIEVLQGLLSGVSSLLSGLGAGLLAATLGF